MKNIVKNRANNWFGKYKYNALLTILIFILFYILGYSKSNINYKLYVNDSEINLVYGIYTVSNEQYIHIDDLVSVFADNVHHDKISGKIIVTTNDSIKKIDKSSENYTQKIDNNICFNLEKIIRDIGNDVIVSNEKIFVLNNKYIEANVKNNRTELFDKKTNNVITLVNKYDNIKLSVDESLKTKNSKTLNVVVNNENETYYGCILKDNLNYKYVDEDTIEEKDNVILVKADDKLMSSTDTKYIDMVAINMYRLSGVNLLTTLEYTNNIPTGVEVFATVNNGHTSSNYDSDITTGMLNSESNREQVIQQLLSNVEKLNGVNIEFGSLKISDKENFTQFIKELSAVLHANNKKLIVSISSTRYIEVNEVTKVADYIVIQPYTARTTASKTSGPISSISYVENILKEILNEVIDSNKVILEIPAYSILWTERKGTVINAERYSMDMMEKYVLANNIQTTLDNVSGQNYINYTKGITTYKMWLEDEYSITQKIKLLKEYDLAGISVYKSGMEVKEVYECIFNNLSK